MPLPAQAREYAGILRSSSKTLLDLINSVLDFSKIESHKLEFENQPFSVRDCLTSAVEMVSAMADAKGLSVETAIATRCPTAAFGVVTRVRQVLVSLSHSFRTLARNIDLVILPVMSVLQALPKLASWLVSI